ncbi:hypothetical protein Ciccas_000055 [Cichlidogyrus casuarinus]|uniref:Histone RNA hairpin-binding protein RNA-binding domain-containing protein n=1 Tax=Cichlidogyrus casuarinus TaxID=1844966 RepID=A0ABD2QP09_9PLAT
MQNSPEGGRKSRKSAPVKNNSFIGAKFKGKKPMENEKNALKTDSTLERKEFRSPARVTRRSERSFSNNSRMRFSTPVRNSCTEPRRLRPRQKSGSTMSITSSGSVRRFHPNYDPTIEVRRAKERFEKYKSQDWLDDMFLHEDTSKDLEKYEAKVKRRRDSNASISTTSSNFTEDDNVDIEKRTTELRRRQRDIDRGKITEKYMEYVYAVPKPEREPWHPQTPNKFRIVSRRAWDGMIKKWRKHLHNFEDREFSICYRSDASSISGRSSNDVSVLLISLDEITEHVEMQALVDEDTVTHLIKFEKQDEEDTVTHLIKVEKHDEEDTLQGVSVENQENVKPLRRSARKRSATSSDPAPDVLHCGLTNDMNALMHAGSKRAVDASTILLDSNPPQSPSKRTRRNSSGVRGVLAKHGQHVLCSVNSQVS